MSDFKFLIVLVYYKRPQIVLNALHSIKNLKYDNWELVFIDDSGDNLFEQTLFDYGLDNSKVKYLPIYDTDEQKIKQGGSRHGQFLNHAILNSTADITTVLCDDDAMVNDSLDKLNTFYKENPTADWSYSRVYFYNPQKEFYINSSKKTISDYSHTGSYYDLNRYMEPMFPANNVDGSQVTYKNNIFKNNPNIRYPYPQTRNLDSSILNQLARVCGMCYPNFVYLQYKGCFDEQMGNRWADNRGEYL